MCRIYELLNRSRLHLVTKIEAAKFDTSMDRVDHLAEWDYKNDVNRGRMEGRLTLPYVVEVDPINSSLYDGGGGERGGRKMKKMANLMKEWLPGKVYHLRDRLQQEVVMGMVDRATLDVTKYRLVTPVTVLDPVPVPPVHPVTESKQTLTEGENTAIIGLEGMDDEENKDDLVDSDAENPDEGVHVDEEEVEE